ncbi:riboflavin synthase [Anaerocolumna sp. AGMB13020]|uniref:riboflavin synthase n=1 Tax=Anaerocolumna sp. AGMB13020 TaxID=3081750 RepID=UPI0029537C5B|nr:riboflavin synthase [Anaerocolumna sp. AGMB13020]WOO39148.1 riboflavin synthase [Anaerocolumna sp. AGMB13020]
MRFSMFTGIIEEIGMLVELRRSSESFNLIIEGKIIFEDLHIGDSISVNGVCLTASNIGKNTFKADVMPETLHCSNLGSLKPGSMVNLERAMPAKGRFGGHMVSGHIDGMGTIKAIRKDKNALLFTISAQHHLLRYIVEKGSVAVDGISLTVVTVNTAEFQLSVIPHTAGSTILSRKKVGDTVNLENDLVGKYLEKLMLNAPLQYNHRSITGEFLNKYGF